MKYHLTSHILVIAFTAISWIINPHDIYALTQVPTILPRSSWATSEMDSYTNATWPANVSNTFPVQRIIIHDTGSDNLNNDSLDSVTVIRSIWRTHAQNNGWGDIGYNYIIARDGKIYQGRIGQNGVRGAHLYVNRTGDNFNYNSIGITLLGRYGSGYSAVPPAMQESLRQLVGWLSAVNTITPNQYFHGSIWNFYTKRYTSSFGGYRVVDHGDVEIGNGDHNIVNMDALRNTANQYAIEYANNLYTTDGSRYYEIRNGVRSPITALAGRNLITISSSQMNLFSDTSIVRPFPNGSLLRTSSGVGYLDNNRLRPIMNPAVFDSRFRWNDVLDVTQSEWNFFPQGDTLSLREGMLVRENTRSEIFVISGGKKHWISSPQTFESMGYRWNNVTIVPDGTLTDQPSGGQVTGAPYLDGTLLINRASPTGIEVLEGGKRRPIPSPEVFNTQYNYRDVVYVSQQEWDRYSQGAPVYFRDGILLRGNGRPQVYIMSDGVKRHISSPEIMAKYGYKWENVIVVSPDGLDNVPEGNVLQ